MQLDVKRILYAVSFAALTVGTVLGTLGEPKGWLGWMGLVFTALLTGYGKYSTSTELIKPDRQIWTEERRKVES